MPYRPYRFAFAVLPLLLVLLLVSLVTACGDKAPKAATGEGGTTADTTAATASSPPPDGTPRLILFLVLDQGRGDLLERYRAYLNGGLGQLLDEGVSFTETHHDHSITSTAPGHATLSTGTHPRRHGVIGNWWVDREAGEDTEAVDDEGSLDGFTFDKSPRRLRVPTLGAWLKARWPESRVWAVSSKDRGALFSAGTAADGALWFDDDEGDFVGTAFYPALRSDGPPWLAPANEDSVVDRMFGQSWTLSDPLRDPKVQAELGLITRSRYGFPDGFPHALGEASLSPGGSYYSAIYRSPFADLAVAEMAAAILNGEKLGQDPWPDLLAVSFSSMDTVGHIWGPESPESADTVLRLDAALGELLATVDEVVGLENVLISLSADHGVLTLPELLADADPPGVRFGTEEITCFQRAAQHLEAQFPGGPWTLGGQTYLDLEGLEAAGYPMESVRDALAQHLETCPAIERVWSRVELEAEPPIGTPGDEDPLRLYANGFDINRSPDLLVQPHRNVLSRRSTGTSHGTPYRYDTHVPWLLRLPAPRPARIETPVATVDIAPTLAALVGIEPTGTVDGTSRVDLLPPPR